MKLHGSDARMRVTSLQNTFALAGTAGVKNRKLVLTIISRSNENRCIICSGAPWLRKFGYLCIQGILVLTKSSVRSTSVRPPLHVSRIEIFHFKYPRVSAVNRIAICILGLKFGFVPIPFSFSGPCLISNIQ